MKRKFLCIKDWKVESGTYFERGKCYEGKTYNNGESVLMYGEVGMKINFHKGSEYFDI